MNKRLILMVICIAFTPRASQTQAQNVPMVITSDYYAQPKTLILHALNNSGKDITGYMVTVRQKNPDGSVDMQGWSGATSDLLFALVDIQMAKDPIVEEHTRHDNGTGLFAAGTSQDITMYNVDGSALAV